MASNSHDISAAVQQQFFNVGKMINVQDEGEHRGGSSSVSKLMATIVPLLIISIPMVLTFFYLRQKQHRVYAPRTFLDVLKDEEKTPKPAFGMFNWISAFRKLPDDFALNHQSLDNYLFIRYLRMLSLISLVGTVITWVVLLWVNAKGGGGEDGLDKFTFSNVSDPDQYYWHTVCAWIFLIFVMYIITRETIYYINLRQAYLTTPRNVARISNRVVLFTGVPEDYRHPNWIRADFQGVKRVWNATDCTELEKLINTMNETAMNLEDAEINLSAIATKKYLKGEKHFADDPERQGTVTGQWITPKERPYKRTIPLLSRKIDAIEYYRGELSTLIPQVQQLQKQHVDRNVKLLPALFVEFESQRAAQAAYSTPFWKQPSNIEPTCIGIATPNEINWENLAMSKAERWARTLIANTIIILLIVFWSIPVGLVGTLADLDNLASFPPLSFLGGLPQSAKGLISGLLPTLLISALLALVPIICRIAARKAGSVTLSQVELRTQGWYFGFQVVQVFLITTFSSGASTVAKQIWDDPTQAPTLLAENLPNASTFYLSFFVLQGIAVTASTIFQIVPFLMFNVLAPYLDTTPRKKFERWITLSSLSWGDTYPKFTLFAVIAIAYSCVAPLVLGFATLGLYFLYLAFRYNVFYVLTMAVDTKGDAYGLAMQHLVTGIYLAELCLIGLMAARGAKGPSQLMLLLFILTILYQIYLNAVLTPLTTTLSDELMAEDEETALAEARAEDDSETTLDSSPTVNPKQPLKSTSSRTLNALLTHFRTGGLFAPFLFHGSRSSYPTLHKDLRSAFPGKPIPNLSDEVLKHAYHHPAITAKAPKIWLVRDEVGISAEEIKACKRAIGEVIGGEVTEGVIGGKVIEVTDEGARFDEKGEIEWGRDSVRDVPIWRERVEF